MKINGIDIARVNFSEYSEIKNLLDTWGDSSMYMKAQSSGSTGEPKMIEISKQHMRNSAELTASYFKVFANSNVLLALPLSFIAGKMMVIRSMVNDWNLLVTDSSSNPHIPDGNIDFAAFTPMQAENLMDSQFEKFNAIQTIILGGGAVSKKLLQKLSKCTNRIFATYGMTETITHVAACELGIQNNNQVFEALAGVEFSTDQRGCLCIKARHLGDMELITNDLVRLEDKYHFSFLGRFDNVINSGGLKIFPEKIEAEIEDLLNVPFYITSMEDDVLGQKVVLMVEGNEEFFTNEINALKEYFGTRIDRPRSIFFRDKFQSTPTGKTIKKFF
jgi:O-succinylbenzoic acid--CoA ligase